MLATVGIAAASSASTVEVAVDGDVHDVRAYGGTVGDVLDRLDVTVGPADEISLDPQTPVRDDLSVDITRAITVEIEIHGAAARRVTAPVSSVAVSVPVSPSSPQALATSASTASKAIHSGRRRFAVPIIRLFLSVSERSSAWPVLGPPMRTSMVVGSPTSRAPIRSDPL